MSSSKITGAPKSLDAGGPAMLGLLAAFLLPIGTTTPDSTPTTLTVVNDHDSGQGSLRRALTHAHDGDTIAFAPGLSGHTIVLTTGELLIKKNVTIQGPGASLLAVSGGDVSRVFKIAHGGIQATIAGLTVTHGLASGLSGGGGILNQGSALVLDDVVLSYNTALGSNGHGAHGGGIRSAEEATLVATDTTFIANRALGKDGVAGGGAGGAVSNEQSVATFVHCNFDNNIAKGGNGGVIHGRNAVIGTGEGGAIFSGHAVSHLTVDACAFSSNLAIGGDGGAVGNGSGPHSTFQGVGTARGGAIANRDLSVLVLNGSNFVQNGAHGGSNATSAGEGAGAIGLALGGAVYNSGTATITDSSLHENEARAGTNHVSGTGQVVAGLASGGAIHDDSATGAGTMFATNVSFILNRAIGGGGHPAVPFGGAAFGGAITIGFVTDTAATAVLSDCTFGGNQAVGGDGNADAPGALALGGAIANWGTAVMVTITINGNATHGGDGSPRHPGGDGLGGGIWTAGQSTLALYGTAVSGNHATGGAAGVGGIAGLGVGGGIFVTTGGMAHSDAATSVSGNQASTSHDDVFGILLPTP